MSFIFCFSLARISNFFGKESLLWFFYFIQSLSELRTNSSLVVWFILFEWLMGRNRLIYIRILYLRDGFCLSITHLAIWYRRTYRKNPWKHPMMRMIYKKDHLVSNSYVIQIDKVVMTVLQNISWPLTPPPPT